MIHLVPQGLQSPQEAGASRVAAPGSLLAPQAAVCPTWGADKFPMTFPTGRSEQQLRK